MVNTDPVIVIDDSSNSWECEVHVKNDPDLVEVKAEYDEAQVKEEEIEIEKNEIKEESEVKEEIDIVEELLKPADVPIAKKKTFECAKCGYKSHNKSNLRKHVTVHFSSRLKQYKCETCMDRFLLKRSLLRHISMRPCKPIVHMPSRFLSRHRT